MKKIILLIIIIASLGTANAQMYNFMGNHVILNMEGFFSPAWINPNPVSSSWDVSDAMKRYMGLNYFLSPSIELMVWEKGTVGVGYDYYNSPFKGSDSRIRRGYQYYGNMEWRESELYGTIVAHGFNAYYKQYLGDRFAPLGHYIKLQLDGFFYHYKMDREGIHLGILSTTQETMAEILENKGTLFGMKFEYGYDLVVFNRLKLNLGASVGTTFGGYKVPFKTMKKEFDVYGGGIDAHYDDYARTRILSAYCASIKIGIGFIPF